MNTIKKEELFEQVSQFLKQKGIDLQEGSYSRTIQKGCQVLADTINLSQQAVERARVEVEKKLEQVRQVIHDKTAPKPPPASGQTSPPPTAKEATPKASTSPRARARRSSNAPTRRKRTSGGKGARGGGEE